MPRRLDLDSWKRREHFLFFNSFDDPFFNVSFDVEVTALADLCARQGGPSFFVATLYLSLRAANEVEEMRYRLRPDGVAVHDLIHGGSTVLRDDETFGFGYFDYRESFRDFCKEAEDELERVRRLSGPLGPRPERDDVVYYSVLPWIPFTSFKHARQRIHGDSVPRIVLGRHHAREGERVMPVSVEVHHALVDGLHVGQFLTGFQDCLTRAGEILLAS